MLSPVRDKENAVVAQASTEHALPLITPEGLHVPLEGVALHLVKHAGDALLNGIWQIMEVPFCVVRDSQAQFIFDPGPRCGFPFADLFEGVSHFLRFLSH